MKFGSVITVIESKGKCCRKGWNGKGMYIEGQFPDAHSKMTKPYIFLKTAQENRIPWTPSQEDIFADDWEVVENV
jgi:hypothetical protein